MKRAVQPRLSTFSGLLSDTAQAGGARLQNLVDDAAPAERMRASLGVVQFGIGGIAQTVEESGVQIAGFHPARNRKRRLAIRLAMHHPAADSAARQGD